MLEKLIVLLFVSGESVSLSKASKTLGIGEEEVTALLQEVREKLHLCGLTIVSDGHSLALATHETCAPLADEITKKEREGELTPASLQTLTVIAYMNFPTKEIISYVRGVSSALSLRTLTARGLISQRKEDSGYYLTSESLAHLGVNRIEDLPDYEETKATFLRVYEEARASQ